MKIKIKFLPYFIAVSIWMSCIVSAMTINAATVTYIIDNDTIDPNFSNLNYGFVYMTSGSCYNGDARITFSLPVYPVVTPVQTLK